MSEAMEQQARQGGVAANGPRRARIVVAVDTSRQSLAALEEAAMLAALMEAELESLFVEDINLLHLCGFPFCNQIGSYTARPRQVDNRAMERELRALAARLRAETARIAQRAQVPWHFQVRRGSVVNELLHAAESALFIGLGRAGAGRRKPMGSTVQAVVTRTTRPVLVLGETQRTAPPLVVIHTGDAASRRALELAVRLAPRFEHQLEIWIQPVPSQAMSATGLDTGQAGATVTDVDTIVAAVQAQLDEAQANYRQVHDAPLEARLVPLVKSGALLTRLQDAGLELTGRAPQRTLILPNRQSHLMAYHGGPAILVP